MTEPLSKRTDADLIEGFKTPFPSFRRFREAVGLDFDEDAEVFWIYWTPGGDEMMVGRVIPGVKDTIPVSVGFGEFDGEWPVWLKLRQMNPRIFDVPGRAEILGSSEVEGSHVLLVEKAESIKVYEVAREGLNLLRENEDPFKVYLASKDKLYGCL